MSIFRPKQYTMKKDAASSTLQNILNACESTSSTPIDEMLAQKATATKGYTPYIAAVTAILIFTLLCPLFFVFTAKQNVSAAEEGADITATDYYVENGMFYVQLEGPFIDYTSIYAVNPSGSMIFPLEYNSGNGMVTFIYDNTEWNIYISDFNSNTVHFLLTPPQ